METRSIELTETPKNMEQLMQEAGHSAGDISSMLFVRVYNTGNKDVYFSQGTVAGTIANSIPIYTGRYENFGPPYNEVFLRSYIDTSRIVFLKLG